MNIGIICNINNQKPVGVIGVDAKNGDIGYISNDNDLSEVIEIILDKDLEQPVKEFIEDKQIIRYDQTAPLNNNYLVSFNYSLPAPWRILGVHYVDGDLEKTIQETFDYIIVRGEDNE